MKFVNGVMGLRLKIDKTIKFTLNEKRGKKMYEELIEKLKNTPAKEYTVQEAEKLTDKILEIKGLANKVAPTPIVSIAKDFGFVTYKADNMPDGVIGNIFIGGRTKLDYGTDKVIIVDAYKPYRYQRIIIAYELACYLTEYTYQHNDKDYVYSHPYNTGKDKIYKCAMELLMPRKIFLEQYIEAIKVSDYDKTYTITYLSELFTVPEEYVKRRIIEVLETV